MIIKIGRYFSTVLFCLLLITCNTKQNETTDICILGGSEAGFTAAIQSARLGKNVILIEPSIAEKIIEELLAREERITIIRKTRIIERNGVQVENNYRQFKIEVDPYLVPGNSSSGLISTIQEGSIGSFGSPDKYIMGFCFRMCLTKKHENRLAIIKPKSYNPDNYEIYRRYLKGGGQLFKPGGSIDRHNGKTDIGSWHDLSANLYGENWKYPAGNYATQDSIVQFHRDFTLGLLWFLQNDEAVDSITRKNWEGWGLPKDEFIDNGNWPRRLYIRCARRLVSDYVITQHQTQRDNTESVTDPVAIAWWPPDAHHARRIVKDGFAYNEGFIFGGDDWRPFGISWRALIPKSNECTNLITPTCLSSSYVAYGAIRIVPTFMVLGQSSGCAASLAIDENINIQDIDYGMLKISLLENGQILDIPENWLQKQ